MHSSYWYVIVVLPIGGPAALAADPNKVFNEEDWTDPEKLDAYGKSKTLAEKAAWDYVKELPGILVTSFIVLV